jgi:hypothetical protein
MPLKLTYLLIRLSRFSIEMTWTGISDWAETGGDDVVYYEVQCDQGSGG